MFHVCIIGHAKHRIMFSLLEQSEQQSFCLVQKKIKERDHCPSSIQIMSYFLNVMSLQKGYIGFKIKSLEIKNIR